jgi:glycosyltransferase involved in cell wall biosynthesis
MSDKKIRVLFVMRDLRQGGAERFLFEVVKSLIPFGFACRVLTRPGARTADHYGRALSDLGVGFDELLGDPPDWTRHYPLLRGREALKRLAKQRHAAALAQRLRPVFAAADLICPIQIENYVGIQPFVPDDGRVVTFLMSHSVQYSADPYRDCDPGRRHRFVLIDPGQAEELKGGPCARADTFQFRTILDLAGAEVMPRVSDGGPFRIGVFTRLHREKPIDPFLYALKSLVASAPVSLHIFGGGDAGLWTPLVARLHLAEHVTFEGHQPDLATCLQRAGLAMGWMLAVDRFVGYASIEIAALGLPLVFWNLGRGSTRAVSDATGGAIQAFSDVVDFVQFNRSLLADRPRLDDLGHTLRRYVVEEFDAAGHIEELAAHLRHQAGEHRAAIRTGIDAGNR